MVRLLCLCLFRTAPGRYVWVAMKVAEEGLDLHVFERDGGVGPRLTSRPSQRLSSPPEFREPALGSPPDGQWMDTADSPGAADGPRVLEKRSLPEALLDFCSWPLYRDSRGIVAEGLLLYL